MKTEPFQIENSPGWERTGETELFRHRYIRLEEVTYSSPGRADPVTWVVARRKAGAVVAPRLADGRFLLILQERYPIQRALWEFPAGQIDDPTYAEDPGVIRAAALRELEEETGHQLAPCGELRSLGHFFSSQGFTDEHAYLFLADGVEPTGRGMNPDAGENILDCRPFSVEEVRDRIARNEIVDANSLAVFARLCALGSFA